MMEGPKDECVLSEDNIYEILLRVTLSSLPSCLRVCRSWRRIGFDPHFDATHSLHSKIASGFILQESPLSGNRHLFLSMHSSSDYPHPISISSLLPGRPKKIYIKAANPIHGLILCVQDGNYVRHNNFIPRYYVTRLATTPHHLRIPNPKTRFCTRGVAIISSIDNISCNFFNFKIVRISEHWCGCKIKEAHLICEVFDSVAQKWTRCNNIPYLIFFHKGGLVIKRTVFWIACQDPLDIRNSGYPNSIFAFNVDDERGRIIKGPEIMLMTSNKSWRWKIITCEERLCMVRFLDEDILVWMMTVEEANKNIQRWEWKGSFSKQYIKNHIFAFEDDIQDQKVVLLETLYRELWFELIGRDLYDITSNPTPSSLFRMHLNQNL